jgi:hypothetical protein
MKWTVHVHTISESTAQGLSCATLRNDSCICFIAGAGWLLSQPGIEPALIADVQAMLTSPKNFGMQERPGGGSVRISYMRPGDYVLL